MDIEKKLKIIISFRNFIISTLLLVLAASVLSFPQNHIEKKISIAPGVIYYKIRDNHDSTTVHELSINLEKGNYRLLSVKAHNKLKARETTSSMFKRMLGKGYNVIAGINADFFNIKNGENENNMIIDGTVEKAVHITDSPYDTFNNIHSQFAFTYKKKPLIERFSFAGSIIWPDGSTDKLDHVNSYIDTNGYTLFNKYQGAWLPISKSHHGFSAIYLTKSGNKGDTLIFKLNGNIVHDSALKIIPDEYILTASNNLSDYLKEKSSEDGRLKVVLNFIPGHGRIETLVGGWPRLIKDGKEIASSADSIEGTFPRFSVVKHPRTGIGFSKDSTIVYLFAVTDEVNLIPGYRFYSSLISCYRGEFTRE